MKGRSSPISDLVNTMINKRDRRKLQLSHQTQPPNLFQIEQMSLQSRAHLGVTVEQPFGVEPTTYLLTVLRHKAAGEAQWMFYKLDLGASKLEWSYGTNDPNLIHGALCAVFPDVEVDLVVSEARLTKLSVNGVVASSNWITNISLPGGEEEEEAEKEKEKKEREKFSFLMLAAPTPPPPPPPAPASTQRQSKATIEGDFQQPALTSLLQSVSLSKTTGRLEVERDQNTTAQVYFVDGNIVHCTTMGIVGEAAVHEVISWNSGNYRIYDDQACKAKTVHKRIDLLMLEGMAIVDQWNRLQQLGLKLDSSLFRLPQTAAAPNFEQISAKANCDINLLKAVYQAVDGTTSLAEVIRRCMLSRPEWVPALYALVGCQLLSFKDSVPFDPETGALRQSAGGGPTPITIDWSQVRLAERSLMRTDTGLLSYYALLGFLEREHMRFETLREPYSFAIFELYLRAGGQLEPLSIRGWKDVSYHIRRLMRKCDIIGHFETLGMALILPATTATAAWQFVNMVADTLTSQTGDKRLMVNAGAASVPEDTDRLEVLIACANPRLRTKNQDRA